MTLPGGASTRIELAAPETDEVGPPEIGARVIAENSSLQWSPDGKYIVHVGASTAPGTGAGFLVDGVWAAAADGSGVKLLYEPDLSRDEVIVGWMDAVTVLVYTDDYNCGENNLRILNVESGEERVMWPDYFSHVAFDPVSLATILAVNDDKARCNGDSQSGIFFTEGGSSLPYRVLEDEVTTLQWSPAGGVFFAQSEFGPLAVSTLGGILDLSPPVPDITRGLPIPSEATRNRAWIGSELWVGELLSTIDNPPRQVYIGEVSRATWGPEGQHLLFLADAWLYVASEPELIPVRVGDVPPVHSAAWDWP